MAGIAPHIHGNDVHSAFCDGRFPQPLPRDVRKIRHAPFPKGPSFNERDVSDKPPFIPQDRLDAHAKRDVKRRYRCALGALRELDRGVGDIVKALERSGELDNTEIVYTSDNGFFFGEHRLKSGKANAYDEALRVPLVVREPNDALAGGVAARVAKPVAQIDLAPTFLDQVGAEPCAHRYCRTMDGRSLTGLLQGSETGWPADRGVLAEAGRNVREKAGPNCGFGAIRTAGYVYAVDSYQGRQGPCTTYRELYDLDADRFELRNRADSASYQGTSTSLSQRLHRLQRCRGIAGRDPNPGPNHDYCE
jgi:N-acetylglucosamine-6-sulfatase